MAFQYKLAWSYEPKDFFHDKLESTGPHGKYSIEDGTVDVKLLTDESPPDWLITSIEAELHDIFKLNALISRRSYSLNCPSLQTPTETKVYIRGVSLKTSVGDVRAHSGNEPDPAIVFIDRIKPHMGDTTMRLLIDSYLKSIDDPQNEFVYLYEVREKLQFHFGTIKLMTDTLNIDKTDFDRFGVITCVQPTEQSRHRGKFEQMRPATQEELNNCRAFIKDIIEKYALHLTLNPNQ
jgi:hypothetical protein